MLDLSKVTLLALFIKGLILVLMKLGILQRAEMSRYEIISDWANCPFCVGFWLSIPFCVYYAENAFYAVALAIIVGVYQLLLKAIIQ